MTLNIRDWKVAEQGRNLPEFAVGLLEYDVVLMLSRGEKESRVSRES